MGNGVGTMGMSFVEFMGMWSLMMTAMMLPAVAPVAVALPSDARLDEPSRRLRFVRCLDTSWCGRPPGVPAFLALRIIDDQVGRPSPAPCESSGLSFLAAAGIYQLTPLKAVCLRHCRSPLAQLLHYGNVKGAAKDLKVVAAPFGVLHRLLPGR
jgi:predicted metal-binding membrane protein